MKRYKCFFGGGVEEFLTKTCKFFVKAQTQVSMFADLFPSTLDYFPQWRLNSSSDPQAFVIVNVNYPKHMTCIAMLCKGKSTFVDLVQTHK